MRGKKIFFEVIAISNIDASQSVNLAAQIPYNFYTKITSINYIKYAMTYIEPLKSEAIHETGLSGNVVASFFPLIIFILLCFNVLSTVPRENRLADFLYIYFSNRKKKNMHGNYFVYFYFLQLQSFRLVSFQCLKLME